jgi:serine/threonine-protein kinase PknG
MRVQLLGVLREVVAQRTPGTALTSAASVLFEAPAITSDALEWNELPALRQDTSDSQYPWLSNIALDDPGERLEALRAAPEPSPEVQLARAKAALQLNRTDIVDSIVNEMLADDPWEWRAVWVAGLSGLRRRDFKTASASFNAVYGQVPGELAAKLALGLSCERAGDDDIAERLYGTCAGTDANYVAPAAFGMARIRAARGDIPGAVQALDLVPSTSRGFIEARRQRATLLYQSDGGLPALSAAMSSLQGVRLDPAEQAELTARILEKALAQVAKTGPDKLAIGPYRADDASLRDGLEQTYRVLAGSTTDQATRYDLVDKANAVRRWTLR